MPIPSSRRNAAATLSCRPRDTRQTNAGISRLCSKFSLLYVSLWRERALFSFSRHILSPRCISQAGNYVRDDVVACTIQLISEAQAQQGYAVSALWRALERDTFDKQPLAQVATWCIGEYGDLLLYGPPIDDADAPVNVRTQFFLQSKLCYILTFYLSIYSSPRTKSLTYIRGYSGVPRTQWSPSNTRCSH